MRYASPIIINSNPQKVTYVKEFYLQDNWIKFKELKQFVSEDESFYFEEQTMTLHVSGTRLETPEEVELRVKKETEYNERYAEYHAEKK